jgi:hypothetical protein
VDYGLTGFFMCTSPQQDATRAAILQTRDVRNFVGTLEQQAAKCLRRADPAARQDFRSADAKAWG